MTTETVGNADALTNAECKQVAWEMFCRAHPVEAHKHDHKAFWKFLESVCPKVPRKRMRQLLKEAENRERN